MQDRNGKVCLFIDKMDLSDVGYFTCLAKNEHGEEKKTIKLMPAGKWPLRVSLFACHQLRCNPCRGACLHKATGGDHGAVSQSYSTRLQLQGHT